MQCLFRKNSKMTIFFKRLSYLILAFIFCGQTFRRVTGQCQDWNLQRLNENSAIYFMNSSISDGFILSCWVWKDSRSGGTWDTRIRIGLDKEGSRGGGFNFRDSNGLETLSLRWVALPGGNVTWRASTRSSFPVSSWNISASGSSWGYSTSSDGRWYFFKDNKTIEPATMPITNVVLVVPQRRTRSTDARKHSSALFSNGHQGAGSTEFFETVQAIFSTVLSTLTSTIANIFNLDFLGGGDSDDGEFTPDPDSEPVTPATTTVTTTTIPPAFGTTGKSNDIRKFVK
ncbi:unnamed protein product [Bemisia tabaci]|uniref:Uncharacterized protein n=2 Tax=Bemisia tabaci TaxID=7038 RepID=A0A9N9ZYJ1_BEMTA|nr:unnamed protein product [Bemisia tabaci]